MIQLKRGFSLDLSDTTLEDGQLCLEHSYDGDDKVYRLKVGDGTTSYNKLPYLNLNPLVYTDAGIDGSLVRTSLAPGTPGGGGSALSFKIKNIAEPEDDSDAATKQYVDKRGIRNENNSDTYASVYCDNTTSNQYMKILQYDVDMVDSNLQYVETFLGTFNSNVTNPISSHGTSFMFTISIRIGDPDYSLSYSIKYHELPPDNFYLIMTINKESTTKYTFVLYSRWMNQAYNGQSYQALSKQWNEPGLTRSLYQNATGIDALPSVTNTYTAPKILPNLDAIYPVGSIYMSTSSTNPASIFGGTWSVYSQGRVLVGYDPTQVEFNEVGGTGGFKSIRHDHSTAYHTLTEEEMPSHTHVAVGGSNVIVNSVESTGEVTWEHGSNRLAAKSLTNTGGNRPHNHGNTSSVNLSTLQPYVVVRIWRRTA